MTDRIEETVGRLCSGCAAHVRDLRARPSAEVRCSLCLIRDEERRLRVAAAGPCDGPRCPSGHPAHTLPSGVMRCVTCAALEDFGGPEGPPVVLPPLPCLRLPNLRALLLATAPSSIERCEARSPCRRYLCDRPRGHDGRHQSGAGEDAVFWLWNAPPDEPPAAAIAAKLGAPQRTVPDVGRACEELDRLAGAQPPPAPLSLDQVVVALRRLTRAVNPHLLVRGEPAWHLGPNAIRLWFRLGPCETSLLFVVPPATFTRMPVDVLLARTAREAMGVLGEHLLARWTP